MGGQSPFARQLTCPHGKTWVPFVVRTALTFLQNKEAIPNVAEMEKQDLDISICGITIPIKDVFYTHEMRKMRKTLGLSVTWCPWWKRNCSWSFFKIQKCKNTSALTSWQLGFGGVYYRFWHDDYEVAWRLACGPIILLGMCHSHNCGFWRRGAYYKRGQMVHDILHDCCRLQEFYTQCHYQ